MSEGENVPRVEQDVYRLLTKTFYLLDDCDRHIFAEYGLSTRQFWALNHLDEHEGCSMVDLSRVLFTDKSNVTGIIDRLEGLKLVVRTPSLHDRRIILITLTNEGRQLRDLVNKHHAARINELMGVINENKLQSLLDHLITLNQSLEHYLMQYNGSSIVSHG